jgi:hypothetical protein
MMSFFEHYMRQPADAYLAAHDGQVPTFEQVLADLSAQRPRRAELLGIAADALRQDLLTLSNQPTPSDPPADDARALADLTAQIWRHPQRKALISATTALLAAMVPAPTTATEGATL